MARQRPKIPVSDFQDLADFCHVKDWDTELHVTDGLWTLKIIEPVKGKVIAKENLRGEPPKVLDQLAMDAALTLVKGGRLSG